MFHVKGFWIQVNKLLSTKPESVHWVIVSNAMVTDWKGRRDPNVIGLFWRHSLVFDRTKIYNEIR